MSLPPEDQSTLKELYDDVLSSKSHVDYSLSVINDLEEQRDSLTEQLVFCSSIHFPIETNPKTIG
jgi:hypothetical protein